MILSIKRPDCERSVRPSAETIPAVTVVCRPNGLPSAITSWPGRIAAESANVIGRRSGALIRMTARSLSGSSPMSEARYRRPSTSATSISRAPATTWQLVKMKPSGVAMNPEPLPDRRPPARTSMPTTAGAARSTAAVTTCE